MTNEKELCRATEAGQKLLHYVLKLLDDIMLSLEDAVGNLFSFLAVAQLGALECQQNLMQSFLLKIGGCDMIEVLHTYVGCEDPFYLSGQGYATDILSVAQA
ncbi:hypothetical protein ACJX0J_041910, partial [Zea mays]